MLDYSGPPRAAGTGIEEETAISARSEIENALYRWAWCYDEYDLEGFLDSVTADATVLIATADGEETGPLSGRAEIGEFYGERLARRTGFRRHLTTNLIIDREDDRTASTRAFLALIAARDGRFETLATGTYRDELRLEEDGRWRISARRIYLETPEVPAP